jgi:hypothetical protein
MELSDYTYFFPEPEHKLLLSQILRILSDFAVCRRVKLSTGPETDFYRLLILLLAEHTKDPEVFREIFMLWSEDDSS